MQWRTLIVNSDNWVIGEHENKDILIWSIKDKPWYNIRTYGLTDVASVPFQLKTHGWTQYEVNKNSIPSQQVINDKNIIIARINFFNELHYRLRMSSETLGISDANSNLLLLHEYLVSKNIIIGESHSDSSIHYENKIRLIKDLDNIKNTVIDLVIKSKSIEDFKSARTTMERLFFTNILL